jgi:hypothetical protein
MARRDPIGIQLLTRSGHAGRRAQLSPSAWLVPNWRESCCGFGISAIPCFAVAAGISDQLPTQCGVGSMPLFLMSGAASGADMNLTIAIAASRCFETANTPAEKTT